MQKLTAVHCKMEKNQKKRKYDIAFLNVLFCMMVVFIHISSEAVTQMNRSSMMFWAVYVISRLCGFSVGGFVLLSGVKLMLNFENMHFGRFYLSRLLSVVLPYAAWVCIYYAYFCITGSMSFSFGDLGHYIIFGDLWAHFYFVVVIVQFYILAPLWVLLFKRANPVVAVAAALIISMLSENVDSILQVFGLNALGHNDILFTKYLSYWTAGCMIGRYYGEFTAYLKRRWIVITLMFCIFTAAAAVLLVRCIGDEPYWLRNVYMLYAIFAILFWYMTAQVFSGHDGVWLSPLAGIDKMTYHIYLIHCLVLVMANNYMTAKGITDLTVRYQWRAVLVYGGSILLCLLWFASKNVIKRLIDHT